MVYFSLQLAVHLQGRWGKESTQGLEPATEGCSLSMVSQPALLWLQEHQLGAVTARAELGPPTSIINQECVPQACPQENLMGAFFSIDIISFQMTSIACVKLT